MEPLARRSSGLRSYEDLNRPVDDARMLVEAQMDEWATYGAQLRAWVGIQVDEQLRANMPAMLEASLSSVSQALLDLRRECSSARTSSERAEAEVASIREDRFRTWSQLEAELQRVELKTSNARSEIITEISDRIRAAAVATAAEEAESRRQLERRLLQRFESIEGMPKESEDLLSVEKLSAKLEAEIAKVKHSFQGSASERIDKMLPRIEALEVELSRMGSAQASAESRSSIEARLMPRLEEVEQDAKDSKVLATALERRLSQHLGDLPRPAEVQGSKALQEMAAQLEAKLEDRLEARFEEHHTWLDAELTKLKQTLLIVVRTELAKAFRSEAAAINALDDELKHKLEGRRDGY